MEQHPVPSHIASFEFKLFGNLTIKQFVTLAIPASVGGIIFFSGLPDTIRFPLSVLFVGFGFLIALVPFGGRPFTKWIVAFVKAILSPTQRIWIKEKKITEFLWVITNPPSAPVQEVQNIDEKSKEKLEAYLATLPKSQTASPLDVSEQVALSNLHLDWHGKTAEGKMPAAIVWPSEKDISKEMGVLADSLPQISPYSDIETPKKGRPSYQKKPALLPRISYHAKPYVLGGIEARLRGKAPAIPIMPSGNANIQPKSHLASETNFATENIIPIMTPDMHIKLLHGIGKVRVRKLHFAPPLGFDLSKLPIRGEKQFDISRELKNRFHLSRDVLYQNPEVVLPQDSPKAQIKTQKPVSDTAQIQDSNPRRIYYESAVVQPKMVPLGTTPAPQKPDIRDSRLTTGFQKTSQPQAMSAQMTQMVPLTNKPNVISGIVLSSGDTPLEGAILIIRNETGVPVRALKSNRLGQFLSATSLPKGNYQLEIDAEGEEFEPVALALNNEILQPIEIRAKARGNA